MSKRILLTIGATLLALTIAVAFPLHRIEQVGYAGKLSFLDKVYAGYLFPKQTILPEGYEFSPGDVLVMYRPSCPDCKKYIPRIRMLLRDKNVIYLSDKTELGLAMYKPNWVPSVYFFTMENGRVAPVVFEIIDDDDMEGLKNYVG